MGNIQMYNLRGAKHVKCLISKMSSSSPEYIVYSIERLMYSIDELY